MHDPLLLCSAAQAASYAQRALDARSAEELEASVLRSAKARAQAEELESRAATAAALATAHQEVSASQADVAEQARGIGQIYNAVRSHRVSASHRCCRSCQSQQCQTASGNQTQVFSEADRFSFCAGCRVRRPCPPELCAERKVPRSDSMVLSQKHRFYTSSCMLFRSVKHVH